ncbi:MAG: DUF1631 family protein, partial [Sinobacterium sp.]|nr:DUF1631 family protein [Sinobacterium sp.]
MMGLRVSLNARNLGITTPTNIEVIIAQLQALTIKQLQGIYADYFSVIEEHVLSLADKAKDNEAQWELFALSRSIKQQSKQLGQRMDQSVLDAFVKFKMGTLSSPSKPSDLCADLSIIQNEELERSITLSSFARRAETRYMESLFTLNQRMAFLSGGKKLEDDGNPFGPLQLAHSLAFMLEPLELNNQLLSFCSRVFERQSVQPLSDLYDEANKLLIDKGFLPHLKYSVSRQQTASEPTPSSGDIGASASGNAIDQPQGQMIQGAAQLNQAQGQMAQGA